MSQENVAAFIRGIEAFNQRNVEGVLEVMDVEVEWHPVLLDTLLGGDPTVYCGHDGIRELLRVVFDSFSELRFEVTETRDLGERMSAIGSVRGRGRISGAETDSPFAWLVEFRTGKAVWVRSYLDPHEALEAAGLSE